MQKATCEPAKERLASLDVLFAAFSVTAEEFSEALVCIGAPRPTTKALGCPGYGRHWFTEYGYPGSYVDHCVRCGAPNPRASQR